MTTKEKEPETQAGETEQAPDSKVRIELEYDMVNSTLLMRSGAPTVILQGILTQALSMISQNQVLQRMQAIQAKSRIVGPNGERPS